MKTAQEMADDEVTEKSPKDQELEAAKKDAPPEPKKEEKKSVFESIQEGTIDGAPQAEEVKVETEQQIEQEKEASKEAVAASQGQSTLRVDLTTSKDNLYVGKLFVGSPS